MIGVADGALDEQKGSQRDVQPMLRHFEQSHQALARVVEIA